MDRTEDGISHAICFAPRTLAESLSKEDGPVLEIFFSAIFFAPTFSQYSLPLTPAPDESYSNDPHIHWGEDFT